MGPRLRYLSLFIQRLRDRDLTPGSATYSLGDLGQGT